MIAKDMVGQRIGRLTIVSRAENDKSGMAKWLCVCDCGGEKIALGLNLRRGLTQSCGCLHKEITTAASKKRIKHGLSQSGGAYNSWSAMKTRCVNEHSKDYVYYGKKGVSFCKRWLSFENFLADMGERPDGTTLDRINPYGDYEPDNCRWADAETQHSNKRKNWKGDIHVCTN
jgi:hypothetical protein